MYPVPCRIALPCQIGVFLEHMKRIRRLFSLLNIQLDRWRGVDTLVEDKQDRHIKVLENWSIREGERSACFIHSAPSVGIYRKNSDSIETRSLNWHWVMLLLNKYILFLLGVNVVKCISAKPTQSIFETFVHYVFP